MKAFFQTSNKMKSNDTYLLFEMIEVQRKKTAIKHCSNKTKRPYSRNSTNSWETTTRFSLSREAATHQRHNIINLIPI